LKDSESHYR
jgi:coiled-coil domain-containing protein 55